MAGNINIREIVYDMLMAVEKEHVPSHILLSQTLVKYQYLDKRDRALISRLFRGTLEYEIFLDYVLKQHISIKWNKVKLPLKMILRMSAYQIMMMDHIPDASACDEAVKLAKRRGFKNLSGFVNGVLRNLSRNKENIKYPNKDKEPAVWLSVRYALPEWLTTMWLKEYPLETIVKMGEAMLADQATTVRVRNGETIDDVKAALAADGIQVAPGRMLANALKISGYDYLNQVKTFADGRILVQDESAMLSAVAAGIKGGEHIIDVCAAPGGKSLHMADLLRGTGCVSARDLTPMKVERIEENMQRTGVANVSAKVQDALELCKEDIEKADIVMADLPCSGLGVMGRKADIKQGMTEEKIGQLAQLQRDILSVVNQYVKPGGVLIYSTCTVTKAENEENMHWFEENYSFTLESLNDYLPESVHSETTKQGWIQILPGQYDSDGFFIARFRKNAAEV